jgi:hypothetical protein
MLAIASNERGTMTRGRWFWIIGFLCLAALVVLFPTTGVAACSNPGGCVSEGSDTWLGLVRWPFNANWAIWTYALVTVGLCVALAVTAIKFVLRSRRTATS